MWPSHLIKYEFTYSIFIFSGSFVSSNFMQRGRCLSHHRGILKVIALYNIYWDFSQFFLVLRTSWDLFPTQFYLFSANSSQLRPSPNMPILPDSAENQNKPLHGELLFWNSFLFPSEKWEKLHLCRVNTVLSQAQDPLCLGQQADETAYLIWVSLLLHSFWNWALVVENRGSETLITDRYVSHSMLTHSKVPCSFFSGCLKGEKKIETQNTNKQIQKPKAHIKTIIHYPKQRNQSAHFPGSIQLVAPLPPNTAKTHLPPSLSHSHHYYFQPFFFLQEKSIMKVSR